MSLKSSLAVGGFACVLLACATSANVASAGAADTHTGRCTERPSADTTVYDTTQITQRPKLRQHPIIRYPPGPQQMNVQGRVELSLIINRDGSVDSTGVQVLTHVDRLLDDEAVRVMTGSWYWPACRGAESVRVRVMVPFDFRIERGQ